MQSKLYRFEILRSLANGVYEAKDPADGSIAFLYEWTPLPPDRAPAKQRLEEIGQELTCEVLTADGSLYVAAASRELGRDAISTLQSHGLFTGTWLDDPPAPPAPPPPPLQPVDQPVAPRRPIPPPVKPASTPWGWIIVMLFVLSGLAFYFGHSAGYTTGSQDGVLKEDSALNPEVRRLNEENSSLKAELTNQNNSSRSSSDALKSFAGTHLLRIKNGCSLAIRTAVYYSDYNQDRLVKGWTSIEPGETAILAASPSADFFVYAEAINDSALRWEKSSTPAFGVAQNSFAYDQQDLRPSDSLRLVNPIPVRVDSYGDVSTFNCKGR